MRVAAVLSLTIFYLLGVALASPVTTDASNFLRDDAVEVTTAEAVLSDDVVADVTVVSVTSRARQDNEDDSDDDDDDATTPAVPVVVSTTRAPVPPPQLNESTILSEFNFVSQRVDGVQKEKVVVTPVAVDPQTIVGEVAPPAPVVASVDDEEEANRPIVVAAAVIPAQVQDSENEIVRDDVVDEVVATTVRV